MDYPEKLHEQFPFLSVIKYGRDEYVGIITSQDSAVTSFYDISALKTELERTQLLELGETWWWESNRLIPISIFLRNELTDYRYCLRTFNTRDVKVLAGPVTKLSNLAGKKTKRQITQLVKPKPYV